MTEKKYTTFLFVCFLLFGGVLLISCSGSSPLNPADEANRTTSPADPCATVDYTGEYIISASGSCFGEGGDFTFNVVQEGETLEIYFDSDPYYGYPCWSSEMTGTVDCSTGEFEARGPYQSNIVIASKAEVSSEEFVIIGNFETMTGEITFEGECSGWDTWDTNLTGYAVCSWD